MKALPAPSRMKWAGPTFVGIFVRPVLTSQRGLEDMIPSRNFDGCRQPSEDRTLVRGWPCGSGRTHPEVRKSTGCDVRRSLTLLSHTYHAQPFGGAQRDPDWARRAPMALRNPAGWLTDMHGAEGLSLTNIKEICNTHPLGITASRVFTESAPKVLSLVRHMDPTDQQVRVSPFLHQAARCGKCGLGHH